MMMIMKLRDPLKSITQTFSLRITKIRGGPRKKIVCGTNKISDEKYFKLIVVICFKIFFERKIYVLKFDYGTMPVLNLSTKSMDLGTIS